jgi:hypothetical protein
MSNAIRSDPDGLSPRRMMTVLPTIPVLTIAMFDRLNAIVDRSGSGHFGQKWADLQR